MKDIFVLLATMAAVHTGFNIVTTLCFLPFTGPFAALVKRIVKERRDASEIPRLVYLDAFQQRVLAAFDVFNALDRARSCLINIAETLAGGKRTASD